MESEDDREKIDIRPAVCLPRSNTNQAVTQRKQNPLESGKLRNPQPHQKALSRHLIGDSSCRRSGSKSKQNIKILMETAKREREREREKEKILCKRRKTSELTYMGYQGNTNDRPKLFLPLPSFPADSSLKCRETRPQRACGHVARGWLTRI